MRTTGEILKALRESRGLTQQQVADIVGARTYTTITKWEKGENFPKGRDIKLLSEYFKVSADYILGLEENDGEVFSTRNYSYIPVSVAAGLPTCIDSITDNELETITLPDSVMGKWAGSKDIYMMRVNGESMNRIIPHNSLIAVKTVDLSSLRDNDIVVFSDDHEYSVKRFYDDKENQRIIFRPDSFDKGFIDYSISYEEAKNLRIHGKVVLYVVELE